MEVRRVDLIRADAAPHMVERPRDVKAEGAPLLSHGLVEGSQAATERSDKARQVGAPGGIGRVAPGECLGDQDPHEPTRSHVTTLGTGRYGAAQIMRSDSARREG